MKFFASLKWIHLRSSTLIAYYQLHFELLSIGNVENVLSSINQSTKNGGTRIERNGIFVDNNKCSYTNLQFKIVLIITQEN